MVGKSKTLASMKEIWTGVHAQSIWTAWLGGIHFGHRALVRCPTIDLTPPRDPARARPSLLVFRFLWPIMTRQPGVLGRAYLRIFFLVIIYTI